MIYLDHAATTTLRDGARRALERSHALAPGNPSGQHGAARLAKYALEEAREVLAERVGARPDQVIFTGGGSEADNLAILGTARAWAEGKRILVSAGEHKAVMSSADLAISEWARLDGASRSRAVGVERSTATRAERIALKSSGHVDLDDMCRRLGADGEVGLVSVMAVNNETGVVQPTSAVGEIVRRMAPRAALHIDAVQAAPWNDLAPIVETADSVAISGHKFGGPQGVGALIAHDPRRLRPLIVGGGQEWGARSGTHNVAGVVAMVAALEETLERRADEAVRIAALALEFRRQIERLWPAVMWNTEPEETVPGIIHLRLPSLQAETVLAMLDHVGVCAAAGSSCQSGAMEPSHVLMAMGFGAEQANESIRLSLGWDTSFADIDGAVSALDAVISQLGGLGAAA
ncbi:MAG: cysteine desulfurase [Actinobacteria bacterium]|nr:cysteine desulfurase [Actinomycetota bacterium]MCB9390804.1 cysteine desulfurase [Acidimicrobiia bacterium]